AIINIHDVALAKQFADRIVGLRAGEIVFDGQPSELTSEILTTIYGEEDWDTTPEPMEEDAAEQPAIVRSKPHEVMPALATGGAR
ncbi:MAG: phosphonate ABC transporter ATP-binding protein, partial [Halomonas sp.]